VSPAIVEYMALPRACALAEVAWSPASARDYPRFIRDLDTHLKRLSQLKVNYRHPSPARRDNQSAAIEASDEEYKCPIGATVRKCVDPPQARNPNKVHTGLAASAASVPAGQSVQR